MRYTIGIDEAGRGPLAGPVSVAAVMIPEGFNPFFFYGLKDSKQLTPEARDEWYARILRAEGGLVWSASFSSHAVIDRKGITRAIHTAVRACLSRLPAPASECRVLLDGGLRAPVEYVRQETLVRGDESVALIAAASIIAKVRRDRHMERLGKKFPHYGFEIHKGYGTRDHQEAIRAYGLSPVHRESFCSSFFEMGSEAV